MIVDRVRIYICAGNGGNGAVSFRREKYVPDGGPDGGDGGRGGNIVFRASTRTRTLAEFRPNQKFTAGNGQGGSGKNMKGENGQDRIIEVPVGTVIIDEETGRVAVDMREEGERVVLKGGIGGKGNARFATPTRRAPRFSTPGKKALGRYVILELKSIADVGLVGFPNVGKSTFLSMVSNAKPKIANYPFTTLSPNLGVVTHRGVSFIMADIPGLIEGASEGIGLGHDFLRHIERTRMIIHIVDVSGADGRNPVEDYDSIREELYQYSEELAERPEIVVANKIDDPASDEYLEQLTEKLGKKGIPVIPMCAAARIGTDEVLDAVIKVLPELPIPEALEEEGIIEEWEMESVMRDYDISRGEDGTLEVNGTLIDEIFGRTIPDDPDSMRHFQKLLEDFGIIKALRDFGARDGDEVRMNGLSFDFVD
ncbi:MAG: GTPase ObgE [Christensenellaceae bacterium]|nr:GTPase ObgE [Christensenellaceae bacterium]